MQIFELTQNFRKVNDCNIKDAFNFIFDILLHYGSNSLLNFFFEIAFKPKAFVWVFKVFGHDRFYESFDILLTQKFL